MITFECWIGIQANRHKEDYRAGAKAAWDFLVKHQTLPSKPFEPKKLLKNIPEYGMMENDLDFTIKETL
jgi:hypothetical protein